jgi:hypothetical protein
VQINKNNNPGKDMSKVQKSQNDLLLLLLSSLCDVVVVVIHLPSLTQQLDKGRTKQGSETERERERERDYTFLNLTKYSLTRSVTLSVEWNNRPA